MKTISPDSFAMLCFLVLMQNGQGISDKAPMYITEKTDLLGRGYDAFAALDINNMKNVIAWCNKWGVEVPLVVSQEIEMQKSAARDLGMEI